MTTFEKVQALFAEQFECDPATITLDTDMVEDLGADSLDVVELSMTVEDECGITSIPRNKRTEGNDHRFKTKKDLPTGRSFFAVYVVFRR